MFKDIIESLALVIVMLCIVFSFPRSSVGMHTLLTIAYQRF